jgi:L-arabinose isomerase
MSSYVTFSTIFEEIFSMRKLILCACLLLTTAPVFASGGAQVDWKTDCTQRSAVAEQIMLSRQNGVSMAETMQLADGNCALEHLVQVAYDSTIKGAVKLRADEVISFRDEAYKQCLDDLQNDRICR